MDPTFEILQRIIDLTTQEDATVSVGILTAEEAFSALALIGPKIVEYVQEAQERRVSPDGAVRRWCVYARVEHKLIPVQDFTESLAWSHVGADLLGSIMETIQRGGGDPGIPDDWIGKRIFFWKTRIHEDGLEFVPCLDCTGSGECSTARCRPRSSMRRIERVGIDPCDCILVYPPVRHTPT